MKQAHLLTRATKWLGALLSAVLCSLATSAAIAQDYPARSVRLVVGFPAGTGPDFVARVVSQKLQDTWGKGVVVDNKPGAAGLIAAQEVARAAPDGYTLLLGEVGQLGIAPSIYKKLAYDPQKDFAPVSHIVSAEFVFVVNPQFSPAKTVKEYVDLAKTQKTPFMATFG